MPSVTYMNQSAPFWDFLASLEQQGSQHPFLSQGPNARNESNRDKKNENNEGPALPFAPWGWGQLFGVPREMTDCGPSSHKHEHDEEAGEADKKNNDDYDAKMNDNIDNSNGEGPSGNSVTDHEGRANSREHHGYCKRGGHRGRCGPSGFEARYRLPHNGTGAHHGSSHHGSGAHGDHHGDGPRGPHNRHGRGGGPGRSPFRGIFDQSTFGGAAFDPSSIAANFWKQFNDGHASASSHKDKYETSDDYAPDADVFDTEMAFVVHVSLPGARKEDVGVNWDLEKSELSVAGVIYRPGDEELLKTLALNERKVGPFERKIRLGTRASPAQVDADGITAKLEEGVLRIEVPKLDGGYVEIHKVDVE